MTNDATAQPQPDTLLGLGSSDGLGPLPEPRIRLGEGNSTWDKYSREQMRAYAAQEVAAERERVNMLRAFVADDAIACTFQTLGQYRVALLRALRA